MTVPFPHGNALLFVLMFLTAAGPLSGCASYQYGRPFELDKVKQIEIGKTTAEEIRRLFGPPVTMGLSVHRGGKRLTYQYAFQQGEGALVGKRMMAPVRNLSIHFRNGVVEQFSIGVPGSEPLPEVNIPAPDNPRPSPPTR